MVLLATPALIKVAKIKHLVDEPKEERKLHSRSVPTIGGIIIFSAFLFSYALWFPDFGDNLALAVKDFKYLIAVLVILFFVGVKDDIIGTAPMKKLVAHIIVGFILVMMAEIKILSLHGLFGSYQPLPEWASALLSIFVYIVIVNAFNLIDGVDGLAAGVGFICCLAFGTWFFIGNDFSHALLAFILAGSLLGFLFFNFMPARIFMGDSGSLTIGAIISVLAIRMIESDNSQMPLELAQVNKPVLAMAIMVYPLIDTIRVFTVRAYHGQSPFSADKNHLHHRILLFGFNHAQTALLVYLYNIIIILSAVLFGMFGATIGFCLTAGIAILFPGLLFMMKPRKK